MNAKRSLIGVGILAGVALTFAAGAWWGDRYARRYDQWGPERLISTAIDSVRANALDALPSDELLRRAVSGMLRELRDPYAALLRPDGAREFRGLLKGDGQGTGLVMHREGKLLTIGRVFAGSPAAAAGVRPGDRVISVNGLLVSNRDESHRAPSDSNAKPDVQPDSSRLVLYRALVGDTLRVTLPTGNWHVPAASDAVMLSRSTGYVALTTISSKSGEELDEAIEHLADQGAKHLVLDLRGNGGGLLEEGVRIASLFLPRGGARCFGYWQSGNAAAGTTRESRRTLGIVAGVCPGRRAHRKRCRNCCGCVTRSQSCTADWRANIWQRVGATCCCAHS